MEATRTLIEMLTYKRPAGSRAERKWTNRYLRPLGAQRDRFGNWVLRIGDAPVLWSSHTDTVHGTSGRQTVANVGGELAVLDKSANCLGADCTTGAWLMREMARAKVPGLYIWHYGEERGCIGSGKIAAHTPELLDGIRYAIAFDRRGTTSIITHQCGRRTASDAFALSLADALGMGYRIDRGGVFTDTDSYADIVPECTNISVGYDGAHSARETQNVEHALQLRHALLSVDWARTELACERDPTVYESLYAGRGWSPQAGAAGCDYDRHGFSRPSVYDDGWDRALARGRAGYGDWVQCDSCDEWLPYEDTVDWGKEFLVCEQCFMALEPDKAKRNRKRNRDIDAPATAAGAQLSLGTDGSWLPKGWTRQQPWLYINEDGDGSVMYEELAARGPGWYFWPDEFAHATVGPFKTHYEAIYYGMTEDENARALILDSFNDSEDDGGEEARALLLDRCD